MLPVYHKLLAAKLQMLVRAGGPACSACLVMFAVRSQKLQSVYGTCGTRIPPSCSCIWIDLLLSLPSAHPAGVLG